MGKDALEGTAVLVLAGPQGRGQMEAQPVGALELLPQFFHERAVAVQARHLVFVLVGHEFEQAPRHDGRESVAGPGGQGRTLGDFFPRCGHEIRVLPGVVLVLVFR